MQAVKRKAKKKIRLQVRVFKGERLQRKYYKGSLPKNRGESRGGCGILYSLK